MTSTTRERPATPVPRIGAPARRASRLSALDGLRLLCALAVAGYHFGCSWRLDGIHPPAHHLPDAAPVLIYGFLGVETFFLISGFVILMSGWGRTVRGFAASRAARLYPAFWACVLVTSVVATLLPIDGGLPFARLPGPDDVLINLTMLAEPLNTPLVDTVYWTLWYELRFYLIVACLIGGGLTDRRVKLFATGWLLTAVVLPAFPGAALAQVVMPDFAPYFIAGMTMFLLRRDRRDPWLWGLLLACWLLGLHRVHGRVLDLDPGFAVPAWPAYATLTAVFLLLLAVALGATDRLRLPGLATAGALTYPFYLLHQRAGYSLIRTVSEATGWGAGTVIAGVVLALLGIAWAVHRFIERPLAPVLNGFLGERRRPHVAAPARPDMREV
ncbi:peptidoglycan/LPS O-acetylase OafA/YrhL [Actinoplanes octamycinicus]|uniref:Peptidoglycan/LPS O-acetylase OafA/YrhL n=1 Tax=Actinoplanes octamycinicus TaxID=135948 RepID=A0A7W7M5R8_9ACTN|nr:acyltransferase [Actinoplanes octamycinicus]MBB4737970.1 peptidoglycan/LPS O-acetylase OafA/YrhL [Actinoplanes octamycinicus]GIE58979.1 acyltransferase [Actinoplanes octamycinicus]